MIYGRSLEFASFWLVKRKEACEREVTCGVNVAFLWVSSERISGWIGLALFLTMLIDDRQKAKIINEKWNDL